MDILHRSKEQRFFFDRIFKDVNNSFVHKNSCSHLIDFIIKGYNSTVFAYGTTGSGKTYTMAGVKDNPGIMVLMIEDIFNAIKSVSH